MGAQIMSNGELFASYSGHVPEEYLLAIKSVEDNPSGFKQLVLDNLKTIPLFARYFGRLVKTRLNQSGYLSSPLVAAVFDANRPVEKRLGRITDTGIVGLESLSKEYRHTSKEIDKIARDLLAEILVLDFLVALGFTDIERPFSRSQAHVDILTSKSGQVYAIEVTRKQEINNWETIEFGSLEDCTHSNNLNKIQSVLQNALRKKNNQFSRAIAAETIRSEVRKVVAIKTSDYGFAECSEQAEKILKPLLTNTEHFRYIDCVWLIPNVEPKQSKWICRQSTAG